MEKEFSEDELQELAKQLNCPSGIQGLAVADNMNQSNRSMSLETIRTMEVKDNQWLLELGHGKAGHLVDLLKQAKGLRYWGIEISELMQQEAIKENSILVEEGLANFSLYDGLQLPFTAEMFDAIFTVNTLYFWENPVALLNEMHRVLKEKGRLYITFAHQDFMQELPFVNERFRLYDTTKLQALISQTAFQITNISNKTEQVKSKTGAEVIRNYSIACLEKCL